MTPQDVSVTKWLTIAPFDHRSSLASSLHLNLEKPEDREKFARLKSLFMEVLSPHVWAVLTDPEFGPATLPQKARQTGVFFSLEESGYSGNHDEMTTLLPSWGIDGVKNHDAGAKLLVYLHPASPTYDAKIQLVAQLFAEARDKNVAFLVEPVLYDPPGVEPLELFSPEWRQTHLTIAEAIAPYCDILKIQYPGGEEECRKISDVHPAWILLSRGVGFDEFVSYLSTAIKTGCRGYAAGRAIWKEITTMSDPDQWEHFLRDTGVKRLEALTALCS